MVVLAVLLLSCLAPDAASAASHRQSADPAPQKAPPTSSSSTPAPDPAPQAAVRSQLPVRSQPSHPTAPASSRSAPTVVAPQIVHTSAPITNSGVAPASTLSSTRASRGARARHHAAKVSHAPPRHPVAARKTESQPIVLSVPLAFLLNDLLRLPHAVLHPGDAGHRDGVLLLLSSLAMGVLAVSSFSLLRRLRRLEGQA